MANKNILLVFSLVLVQSFAVGRQYRPREHFTFNADFARFRYDSTSTYLEIYYGFYPRVLSCEKIDSVYAAKVVVRTRILKNGSDSTVLNQQLLVPIVVEDTTFLALNSTFVSQTSYAVPYGDYTLEIVAFDSLQPANRDSVRYPLLLQPVPSSVSISDLELCSEVSDTKHQSKLFEKNSLEAIPNPSQVFGAGSHPVSFYYAELYNLTPDSTYTIKARLLDGTNKVVRETTKDRKYSARNEVDVGMMNVSSFLSGRYLLNVAVFGQDGKELCQSAKTLFLNNPHVRQPAVSEVALNANQFAGMTSDELAQEFQESRYLATPEELERFEHMTTLQSKKEFLAKFWNDVERGQGGRKQVERKEYLHRVAVANQRYSGMGKNGWQTDRGRVYLVYGEPDEVERFPNSGDSKPYEIWHYYQLEGGVEFDFIDRTGFGNYILVNSTKRGEIQDAQWQQYLQ